MPDSPAGAAPEVSQACPAPTKVLGRFFRLLESARPADLPEVLAGLPEADLAAAVTKMEGRLTRPARDYLLAEGPSAALVAMVRQVLRGRGEDPEWIIDRVLMRFDPDADEEFFAVSSTDPLVLRARRAILRDRQGPDGHAVIAPGVKRRLFDSTAAFTLADWWDEMAHADDPDLVLALMPHASWLSERQAARVIATLDAHGLRAEARRHRGLWEYRGSAFRRLGFRRFDNLRWIYKFESDFSPAPERMEAVSADLYRELVDQHRRVEDPQTAHRLRTLAWTALRAGTMSPAEVLEHTRPAALALSLAVPDDGVRPPGEPRAADDMRVYITEYAAGRLTDSPRRWAQALLRTYTYRGTIPELFRESGTYAGHDRRVSVSTLPQGIRHAANILLASAPREVAARALAFPGMEDTITTAVGMTPLCQALVDHVVAVGTFMQRLELAANAATPDAVLGRLIDESPDPDPRILFTIMGRTTSVSREVVERAFAVAPRGNQLKQWISGRTPVEALDVLRHMAEDPAWVLSVLQVSIPRWGRDPDMRGRMAAYVLLAEVAGLEAVWALELELAGSLEAMAPFVRESMAGGDAEPLIGAARAFPVSDSIHMRRFLPSARNSLDLDRPLDRPLEHLVRTHLDGRPDRWLHLAALLRSAPEERYEELIAEAARLP